LETFDGNAVLPALKAWLEEEKARPSGPPLIAIDFETAVTTLADAPIVLNPVPNETFDGIPEDRLIAAARDAIRRRDLDLLTHSDGYWMVAFPVEGRVAQMTLDDGSKRNSRKDGRPRWEIFALVSPEQWEKDREPVVVERTVWTEQALIRKPCLPDEAVAIIEQAVAEDTLSLESGTVSFHTVFLGPLVVLCSFGGGVLNIFSLETEAEYEAAHEPVDVEVEGMPVRMHRVLMSDGGVEN